MTPNTHRGPLIGQTAHAEPCHEGPTVIGVIRDETKNTITIENNNGSLRRIIKNNHTITLTSNGEPVVIDGAQFCSRFEDRISMKKP